MIVWINGPFGGGKTTLAKAMLETLPDAVLFDPEWVGYVLRGTFPGKRRDFQDFPAWPPLVAEFAIRCHEENDSRPVVVPMTLLRRDYAVAIHSRIRTAGVPLRHLLLHADAAVVGARIEGSTECPGDEAASEQVRAFRRSRLGDYTEAYGQWLAADAAVIDTTHLTPDQVAARATGLVAAR
ncbi:AAA family ATPase [Kitasatospora sp. NPDC054939]